MHLRQWHAAWNYTGLEENQPKGRRILMVGDTHITLDKAGQFIWTHLQNGNMLVPSVRFTYNYSRTFAKFSQKDQDTLLLNMCQ